MTVLDDRLVTERYEPERVEDLVQRRSDGLCACGCGKSLKGLRADAKTYSESCRKKANRQAFRAFVIARQRGRCNAQVERKLEGIDAVCAGKLVVIARQGRKRTLRTSVAVCRRHKAVLTEKRLEERHGERHKRARRQQKSEALGNREFVGKVRAFVLRFRTRGPKSAWERGFAERYYDDDYDD